MTIRLLLADDRTLLRAAFRILIDSCADMVVVAEATDGREAVELARAHRPDVVLMNIRLPGTDGLTATTTVCADPELTGTRVLILATAEIDQYVAQALRAGASGFLGRHADADTLLGAVRTVASGEALLSPLATRAVISRYLVTPVAAPLSPPKTLAALTAREREVMTLAAEGHSNTQIADRLDVSPMSVRTDVGRAMTKLNARDRAQLVVVACQLGLAGPVRPAVLRAP
ncbi:response regulator [Streptomyces sp. NPDC059785]|uniref:response regulator transcription factor n=1 Tax=unclassified Streptomyces TaxID=2593676 RepID=UPI003649FE80